MNQLSGRGTELEVRQGFTAREVFETGTYFVWFNKIEEKTDRTGKLSYIVTFDMATKQMAGKQFTLFVNPSQDKATGKSYVWAQSPIYKFMCGVLGKDIDTSTIRPLELNGLVPTDKVFDLLITKVKKQKVTENGNEYYNKFETICAHVTQEIITPAKQAVYEVPNTNTAVPMPNPTPIQINSNTTVVPQTDLFSQGAPVSKKSTILDDPAL